MSEQKDLVFGTDPHKLHRSDAPDTSVAAAHKVDTVTDEKRVYDHICMLNFGDGVTLKELARQMKKQSNQISGRITALIGKGLVTYTGERREGCRVLKKNEGTFVAYCGFCKAETTMIQEAGQYFYCEFCKGV